MYMYIYIWLIRHSQIILIFTLPKDLNATEKNTLSLMHAAILRKFKMFGIMDPALSSAHGLFLVL